MKFTADNELQLNVNGVEIPIAQAEAGECSILHISNETRLIVVKANNTGSVAGILGSTGNRIVTDGTWQCSDSFESDWNQMVFEDEEWTLAAVVGNHEDGPWGIISSISNQAKWISVTSILGYSAVWYREMVSGFI